MTKYSILLDLVKIRRDDAWALFETGIAVRRNGALYLAGYSVECAIKARICQDSKANFLLSNFQLHDWRKLIQFTRKWRELQSDGAQRAKFDWLHQRWDVAFRYQVRTIDPFEVKRFIRLSEEFAAWLLS